DPLAGQKFEAGSPGVVVKEAFRALHPLGSGSFRKAETGHEDTFELRPDEAGTSCLRERVKAGGTLMIVAVPDDEVAVTYFGGGGRAGGQAAAADDRWRAGEVTDVPSRGPVVIGQSQQKFLVA